MNLKEYQELCKRTESIIPEVKGDLAEFNNVLNAFIIVGEMLDCYKKKYYYHNDKKYNEQYQELSRKLKFFSEAIDRHSNISNAENTIFPISARTFHGIIGAASESAELVQQLEKIINGKQADTVNIQEEIGDHLWYFSIINDDLNFDPEDTMKLNIAKLAKRYPEKYSDDYAENRDLESERKILEGNK